MSEVVEMAAKSVAMAEAEPLALEDPGPGPPPPQEGDEVPTLPATLVSSPCPSVTAVRCVRWPSRAY